MPWVRKERHPAKAIWIVGVVLGTLFGVLLGYERWGSTAAVVAIVEKELNGTESRIAELERRLLVVESKLVRQESSRTGGESTTGATEGKMSGEVKRASSDKTEPVIWRRDSY